MDMVCVKIRETAMKECEAIMIEKQNLLCQRLTPFMITFCETNLTTMDMLALIEAGLTMVRFKMWKISEEHIMSIMSTLHKANRLNCDKNNITTWPIATCVDIPNACIRTGYLEKQEDKPKPEEVLIKVNSIIVVTCNKKFMTKCNSQRIYIDDPYTFTAIKVGTQMSVKFGRIIMICIGIVNPQTIKSKVVRGDFLGEQQVFCIRGVKHTKPPLSKNDLDLIEFVKENEVDFIAINSLRRPQTLANVKYMLKDKPHPPLVLASICEQEGIDNIDEIIKLADGIILAREFLEYEIEDVSKILTIELNICGKCRQAGKPIFLSGNILETTLRNGTLKEREISDITNGVIRGTGFILRDYYTTKYVTTAMNIMNNVCQTVETMNMERNFWRLIEEYKMPVNAAVACIQSCALMLKVTNSKVCVVVSVTGTTAKQLSQMQPDIIILTIVTDAAVARQLKIYRGIVPIVYTGKPKKKWHLEMNARVFFAAEFGLKYDILKYGHTYVAFRRSMQYSMFCDNLSIWHVTQQRKFLECAE